MALMHLSKAFQTEHKPLMAECTLGPSGPPRTPPSANNKLNADEWGQERCVLLLQSWDLLGMILGSCASSWCLKALTVEAVTTSADRLLYILTTLWLKGTCSDHAAFALSSV